MLGADDPELVEEIRPVMDLLAADIASSPANEYFPGRRTFDAYASHSWASGTSPFADGNNQESSSRGGASPGRGCRLWARPPGRTICEREATWLLALEAQSARALLDATSTESDPVYDGYGHSRDPAELGRQA